METQNGTSNDWTQFSSFCETYPSSFDPSGSVASSSFKISTETYPTSTPQGDTVPATTWEVTLDQSLLHFSSDRRVGLTDSTAENNQVPTLSICQFSSGTGVVSQDLRRDDDDACGSDGSLSSSSGSHVAMSKALAEPSNSAEQGAGSSRNQQDKDDACSSDSSSSSDNDTSPLRYSPKKPRSGSDVAMSRELVEPSNSARQGEGSSRNQQGNEYYTCSSDGSSSSGNSPRYPRKEWNSHSALELMEAVGGPPPPPSFERHDVGPSGSNIVEDGNVDKRPFDPEEMTDISSRSYAEERDWAALFERRGVLRIEVYLLSPKSVDEVKIWFKEGRPHEMTKTDVSLGKGINGKLCAWCWSGEVHFSPRKAMLASYQTTIEKKGPAGSLLSWDMPFVNHIFDTEGRQSDKRQHQYELPNQLVHVDVCDDEGVVKHRQQYTLVEWLAVLSTLVGVTGNYSFRDTFSEYFHKRPVQLTTLFLSRKHEPSEAVKVIPQWASHVREDFQKELKSSSHVQVYNHDRRLAAKEGLVSVALLDMLMAVRNVPEELAAKEKDVADAFLKSLVPLRRFFEGARGDKSLLNRKVGVRNFLQASMGHLVSCVSAFGFGWLEHLDLFTFFDPTLEFLDSWRPFRFESMSSSEIATTAKQYEDAVSKLSTCDRFKSLPNRRAAAGRALKAAPTVREFLQAARRLEQLGWLSLLGDEDHGTERVLIDEALGSCVSKITEQHEMIKQGVMKARLQRHLELAVNVEPSSVYPFLAASFRDHLSEILQQILSLEEQSLKDSLSTLLRASSTLTETILSVVVSPHAFTAPLRPCEVRLLEFLTATTNAKSYDAGRSALVSLANRESSYTTYREVLRVWVRGTARRKGSTGENTLPSVYLPPHAFLAALAELADAGVEPSLVSRLAQMAMSMAVEECRNLSAFLQDSKKITHSQARPVRDHYLNEAGRMMETVLDSSQTRNHLRHTASDSLLALSHRTPRDTLVFQNLIGEQLCLKLLDTIMRACGSLKDDLELRPIETMVEVKFATLLMQIEKCPQSVKSHPLYKLIHAACEDVGSSLKSRSVSLRYINLAHVREDWEKMFHIFGNPGFVTALENAHKDVVIYKNRLQGFKVLVEDIPLFLARSNILVEGCTKWRDWFTRRSSEWESFTFSDIQSSPDHWPREVHEAIYTYLDSLITLQGSGIFRNVLLELVLDCAGGNAGLVTRVSSSDHAHEISLSSLACVLFPQAVHRYQDEMRLFVASDINFDRIIMERVCFLLNEVDPNAVEAEFEIARSQLGWGSTKSHELLKNLSEKEPTIVEYLQSWKGINILRELHVTLPLVASVFELRQDCDGLVSRIWNVITECTLRCSLRSFRAVLQRDGQTLLTRFSTSEVDIWKELTKSGELIAFLRQTVQEDLRHLLDAVEVPNASQTWEGLINDLIDLQRIFRPILSAKIVSFEDLRASIFGELKASSSNFLCEKLTACNKEASKLRKYFLGVANRTHKDNDQIAGILKSGQYHFLSTEDGCSLELKCSDADPAVSESLKASDKAKAQIDSSQGEKSYNLPQLQELRSRARWNVTSNRYLKTSKTAQAFETDEETVDISERSANVFISHIDVAERIVAVVTELHNCGHFSYAKFQKVVHSFAELQMLADQLKASLRTWEAAISRARNEFPCLNSFRAVELRLIVEKLMLESSTEHDEKLEHCFDLFKWTGVPSINVDAVKRAAARSKVPQTVAQIANSNHVDNGENLIFNLLRIISSVMESSIFFRNFSIEKSSKERRGILLADVDDPEGEIYAVATLFGERDLVLHGIASNVIVCGPLTPYEELYLLILRYLNNVGQENYFFCIAHIERLSFECLSQLTTLLQRIVHEYPICENELAMVSCSRSKISQTLSQRLKIQVRHMAFGTTGAIGTEDGGKYSKMWVITSDLPGMGKTRHVEKFAETNHVGSMRTMTISGEVSRTVLIQRLKALFLHLPPDQLASSVFLHLDISVVSNPETLNDLLFELLVLGCLKSDRAGLFHLTTQHVAIEVANTYHNFLASKLPVCRWFKTEHLVWNIHNFVPSDSATSDDQLACNYLQSLEDGNVNVWNPGSSGPRNGIVVAIPFAKCRELLRRYFVEHLDDRHLISFSLLQTFMKFFARQLREFSDCPFFLPENLAFMRAHPNTRLAAVTSILEVARGLSIRSVKPWLDEQQESTVSANAEALMATRMNNMQRWSDSKHVMIFFQLKGRMAVLYKHPRHVPPSIVDLFHKQKAKLPQYESLTTEQLYEELWPILHKSQPPAQDPSYVLTADNFLKMALIFMKVKANVPVVIMGETGCGKTSLLQTLAHYCSVVFVSLTLHAGTTEENIRVFLREAEAQAANRSVWAFLDEINACDHLGFLVGVVCRRLLDGRPLHQNVKVLAACNPYRKHDSRRHRAGLSARKMLASGTLENLDKAYTVHPLPEALVENVQDFGVLNAKDEQLYFQAMVRRSITKDRAVRFPFLKLLVMSQAFVKEKCGEASVSLRDATRCIDLFAFFSRDLESRPRSSRLSPGCRERRATLLAFAHCYYYRLANDKERTEFKAEYVKIMNAVKWRAMITKSAYSETKFERDLVEEQMSLLSHMEIEPGIAKNQALRENVFVTLTCILQKIPLFVVGKPGSGKTLALQLIFSNLRGSGMKDPYFRLQPTMFMFSYQGSESSTSDGILKAFERAYRCVEDNKKKNVNAVVVVVLDEVGLAEISSHNPLKVLHALLEPDGERKVAVVGISNWSLDAAKMNRAIHISQPDPSVTDLVATGEAILDSYGMQMIYGEEQMIEMKWLARVYHEYHEKQSKPDFHGLRDFYSLIKSLRGDPNMPKKWSPEDLKQALWRNFGGSPEDTDLLVSILSSHFRTLRFDPPPALDLVKANLIDKDARHLMLISTGESAITFVESMLQGEKLVIVHGSKYKDDCSDDYAYLMLSNIILHMENGRHILLKGVERIWSSLYDMLNQHYTIVGGRRNCRIALGAFSNPLCYVHENFRCIVVVDQTQVQSLDPPFLNRFEKQVLTSGAMLTSDQQEVEEELKKWVKGLACLSEDDSGVEHLAFGENDLFANYSADTLASLLLGISSSATSLNNTAFLDRCKEELLLTAYPDAIMRAHYSKTCLQEVPDAKKWTDKFFQKPGDQESLFHKICQYIGDKALWKDTLGVKLVVTTRSNIHTDIRLLLQKLNVKMQIIKLGDFTNERQLIAAVQRWSKSFDGLLVIQSDTVLDKDHLRLAKVHVERARAALLNEAKSQSSHVVFILHSHRGEQQTASPFSFLSGWKQITLDQLHQEHIDYREYLDKNISELVQSEKLLEGHMLMVRVLTWSFLCIKYPRGKQSAAYCQRMVKKICNDKDLYNCFIQRAVFWLEEEAKSDQESGKVWQTSVVCNRGRLALASNLHHAFSQFVVEKLREPIARLVYVLESKSALGSYFNMTLVHQDLWRSVFMDREKINIENVPQPMHPEGYTIKDPLELQLPFSSLYAQHVDSLMQELYLARVSDVQDDDDDNAAAERLALEMEKDVSASLQSDELMLNIERCVMANPHDYCHDFAILYAPYQSSLRPASQALVFEWLIREKVRNLKPLMLHALVWTKLETLKAQALLANSCYTADGIAIEVNICKRSNAFTKDFDDKFASRCVVNMLPLDESVIARAGGLESWLHRFGILIKLVSNVRGPRLASIMLMLRVLQDFAQLVICPLAMASEDLCSLTYWFERQRFAPSPDSLITKITSLVPDMNTLQESHRDAYFRFLASTFSRLLDSTSVTLGAISAMSGEIFSFRAPTCLIKGVMVRLLRASAQLLIPAKSKRSCPPFLQLCTLNCRRIIREQASGSLSYEPYVLLSDVIYESVRGLITAELMSEVDESGRAFDFDEFFSSVRLATSQLSVRSKALSLPVACAFAVLRSVMEVLAQDMLTVEKKDPTVFKPRLATGITKTLTEFFEQKHHNNVLAMKLYLMKVLRYHCGLSIQSLSHLANECSSKSLKLYSLILHRDMLMDVDNPLGFNPFTSLFPSYENAEELLCDAVDSEGEGLQRQKLKIQDLPLNEQGAMASAVASKLFLVRASRNPFEREVSLTNWLLREANLQSWDQKWVEAVHCLAGAGALELSTTTTSEQLQFKALAAHILLVVSSFAPSSPLRRYMALEVEDFMLASPDNLLSALRGALTSSESLGIYKHSCGYVYVIGNCTQPNQRARCPNCGGSIGGSNHLLDAGNVPLQRTVETGYIPDHVARSDRIYTVRGLELRTFRVLRLVVHSCILLGLFLGRSAIKLAATLNMPVSSVMQEVKTMIEEDLGKLGTLLNRNREMTCQLMHCFIASMVDMSLPERPLTTPESRQDWETSFQNIVNLFFKRSADQTVAQYMDAHRRRNELIELLEERRLPPFPAATVAFTRISVVPNFTNYLAMYMQDAARRTEYPIIEKLFEHMEKLSEMKHLLALVRFSKAVHEQLCSKITRPEAASITVSEYFSSLTNPKDRRLQEWFPDFAKAWNVMRHKVTAFECTEFKQGILEMNVNASIGFCLVESRDLGIYLAAILDHLRTIQNTFLDEVAASQQNEATIEGSSRQSVRVQICKAEDVIDFDEQWLHTVVCHAAMASLQFGQGQNIFYDDCIIAQQLRNHLVDEKPLLDPWEPFLYKHEAFHKHMTIILDVGNRVRQIPLGSETLQGIQNEIECTGTVGAGRYLVLLDLCLGVLRRTGGDPTERLVSYINRWLGDESLLLVPMHSFHAVQLQHVVSLYEGLEDSASVGIQAMVNSRYRTPLSPDLIQELSSSVELKHARAPADGDPKISAELFHVMLRRFMFRYLIGDQLNPAVPLSTYINDRGLIQWPEDVVDDPFPPSLLVEHSHATYVYLTERIPHQK